ncbi:MAG: PAS domain-containing sensor histidine kinase, partial [Methermicoccaceae archaeon]
METADRKDVSADDWASLKEELDLYRLLVENANIGTYVIQDGKVVECNREFQALFGYAHHEVVGKPVSEFICPEDMGRLLELLRSNELTRHLHLHVRATRRDGKTLYTELVLMPTTYRGKEAIVGTIRDISLLQGFERSMANIQRELESLQRRMALESEERMHFVEMLSHEMRTPLTIIMGYLELIKESEHAHDPVLRKQLESISKSVERLDETLSTIFKVAELDESGFRLQKESVELHRSVERVVEGLSSRARAKKIEVELELEPATAVCDPNRMETVIEGLLSNAIKFTPQGGSVHVRMSTLDRAVHLEVEDTGTGIPQGSLKKIFDRFYIAHDVNNHARGLGMGLYLARR